MDYKLLEDGLVGYSLTAPELDSQVVLGVVGVVGTAIGLGLLFHAAGGGEKKKQPKGCRILTTNWHSKKGE